MYHMYVFISHIHRYIYAIFISDTHIPIHDHEFKYLDMSVCLHTLVDSPSTHALMLFHAAKFPIMKTQE